MTEEQIKEILEYNNPKFQYSKLAEELSELSSICLKKCNKHSDNHPSINDFIEELGDVTLRLTLLIKQEDIIDQVMDRAEYKLQKLLKWKSEGKYKGGL